MITIKNDGIFIFEMDSCEIFFAFKEISQNSNLTQTQENSQHKNLILPSQYLYLLDSDDNQNLMKANFEHKNGKTLFFMIFFLNYHIIYGDKKLNYTHELSPLYPFFWADNTFKLIF